MKLQVKKGSTDVTLYAFIQDSSSTTGAGLTGLAYNTASLVCYYVRPLGSATALTLATQTVTGAHTDGGFVEVSSANMPGVYRLDLSDAIIATGVNSVALMLKGATNMATLPLEIELVAYDPQSATSLGLSNLDSAVSSRASQTSLDTVDDFLDTEIAALTTNLATANTNINTIDDFLDTEVAAIKAKTDQLTFGTANRVDAQVYGMEASALTAAAIASDAITAAKVAADVTTELQSGLATASALSTVSGKIDTVDDFLDTEIAALTTNLATANTNINTIDDFLDTEIAAIKAKTDNLPAAPAAVADIPTANANADALLDRADGIETGYTLRQAQRVQLAALAGELSGAATSTVTIRDITDTKARITATVDADGNRTALTIDAT